MELRLQEFQGPDILTVSRVRAKVLLESPRPLEELLDLMGRVGLDAALFEDLQDRFSEDGLHLWYAVLVPKPHSDLARCLTLLGPLDDERDDLVGAEGHPGRRPLWGLAPRMRLPLPVGV